MKNDKERYTNYIIHTLIQNVYKETQNHHKDSQLRVIK